MTGELPPCARVPVGRDQLAADLRSLGLQRGQDLLIHCSLRQCRTYRRRRRDPPERDPGRGRSGGDARGPDPDHAQFSHLESLSGRHGPPHGGRTGPLRRRHARIRSGQHAVDRNGGVCRIPADPPVGGRSSHPQVSFAALGPGALDCTSVHDLDCHLGDRSPLGWLYAADAAILLLGVDYSACTAFHLAEYRLPGTPRRLVPVLYRRPEERGSGTSSPTSTWMTVISRYLEWNWSQQLSTTPGPA